MRILTATLVGISLALSTGMAQAKSYYCDAPAIADLKQCKAGDVVVVPVEMVPKVCDFSKEIEPLSNPGLKRHGIKPPYVCIYTGEVRGKRG